MKRIGFKYGWLWLFTVLILQGHAQHKKAEKLVQENRFAEAIRVYEKEVAKRPGGHFYFELGNLYLKVKQYEQAKTAYSKALDYDDLGEKRWLSYAKICLQTEAFEEAKTYFEKYQKESIGDYRADLYVKSINEIVAWKKESPAWEIKTVEGINTEIDEFSPVTYRNGLFYVSQGKRDWVNYVEDKSLNQSFYDIFYAQSGSNHMQFQSGKLFSGKLISDYHDGPVALTPDSSQIYFSRLIRTGKTERFHLFFADIINGEIQKVEEFDYNTKEYSILHPSFSSDGNLLFFASDKNGGIGGFDIFVCKKQKKYGWSAPRPVPGLINTGGNELFPHYYNGNLYFASDGHYGYGGLDVFVANENEQFKVITNLKAPLNSSYDDFSIYFTGEKTGYFASNRQGGKGGDDIYYFKHLDKIRQDEYPTMMGVFEFNKLAKENVTLVLYDEEGVEMARVKTDELGRFEFRNLNTDKKFTIKTIGDYEDAELFITNSSGEKLVLMRTGAGGEFLFRPLKSSEAEIMLPIIEEVPTFLTIPLAGYAYKKMKGDLGYKAEVVVYDQNNELVARTYTDKEGNFLFRNLVPDEYYVIKILMDEDAQIVLLDGRGKRYEDVEKLGASEFIFRRLKSDEVGLKIINEENVIIQIRKNERFELPSIYYDYNSSEINAQSAEELNKLYILMKKNPHIEVVFESHTDSRGKDEYNLKLSEKRAKSAVDYLEKKGIPKERLKGIGYGETRLLNECKNEVNCNEEQHAINRRTEISITGKSLSF
jgi:outer membrane protein OmpA-like peptidoglycan-associated protein/tetratricopeptide (TPR) repeat protein